MRKIRPLLSRRLLLGGAAGLAASALAGCNDQAAPASTSSAPSSAATPTPSPTPRPVATTPPVTAKPTPTAPKPPVIPPDPLPKGVVNALVFGSDARDASFGGRSDAIVLAQLSADRKHLTLVSIARDTLLAIPGVGRTKINAAFSSGGTALLTSTVSQSFGGVPIHVTVQADFTAFIRLSTALQGVQVLNRHASSVTSKVTGHVTRFPSGKIAIGGADLLIYARQRHGLPQGDLDRAERHRAVLIAMLQRVRARAQASPKTASALVAGLFGLVRVTGPVTKANAAGLLRPLAALDAAHVTSLMVPLTGFGMVGGASVDLIDQPQLAALNRALKAGDIVPYVKRYGTGYTPHG